MKVDDYGNRSVPAHDVGGVRREETGETGQKVKLGGGRPMKVGARNRPKKKLNRYGNGALKLPGGNMSPFHLHKSRGRYAAL